MRTAVGELGLNLLLSNAAIYDRSDCGGIEVQTRDKMQSHFNVNVTGGLMLKIGQCHKCVSYEGECQRWVNVTGESTPLKAQCHK